MMFGFLKSDNNNIIFNNYDQGDTTTTLKHLVGGNLDYVPLRSLIKPLPKELKNVSLVINSEPTKSNCKPNLLIEEDIIAGDIVIVKIDEDGHIKGLTDCQVKALPSEINRLIVPRELGKVFGY